MQKFTVFLGTLLATAFLLGLATTLTRSTMIGFFDVLPVYILMAIAIFMMVYEAFFDKKWFQLIYNLLPQIVIQYLKVILI